MLQPVRSIHTCIYIYINKIIESMGFLIHTFKNTFENRYIKHQAKIFQIQVWTKMKIYSYKTKTWKTRNTVINLPNSKKTEKLENPETHNKTKTSKTTWNNQKITRTLKQNRPEKKQQNQTNQTLRTMKVCRKHEWTPKADIT